MIDILKPFKAIKAIFKSLKVGIGFPWYFNKRNYKKCLALIHELKKITKEYYGSWDVSDELRLRDFIEEQGNMLNMNFESRLLLELYMNNFE